MFQDEYHMDDALFPLGLSPYDVEYDRFALPQTPKATFRSQKLSTYIISDLFSAKASDTADFDHMTPLASPCRNKEIMFTGERLDQWDLDVLLYCTEHTPMLNGKPELFQVTPPDLLHSLGLRNTMFNRKRLFSSIQRQQLGVITIRGNGYQYMTRLLDRVLVDARQELCLIEINGDVAAAFRNSGLTQTVRDRWALGRNPLAKWLHGAIQVFTGGFAANMQCLHWLCRPGVKQPRFFAKKLRNACATLQQSGHIESWSMDGAQMHVSTPQTRAVNKSCGLFRFTPPVT